MSESLTDHLVTVNEPALTALLNRRPDAVRGAEPRDLAELAERLSHPASLMAVISTLPRPCLQLTEATVALGAGATRARLLDFLDDTDCSDSGHEADVDLFLSELYAAAVAWPGRQDRIRMPDTLRSMFGAPLQLGQPLSHLLTSLTFNDMCGIQDTLGLKRGRSKADATASLLHHLSQPDIVRAIVQKAPPVVRTELLRQAQDNDPFMHDAFDSYEDFDDLDDLDVFDNLDDLDDLDVASYAGLSLGTGPVVGYDPVRAKSHDEARRWAVERGIMIGNTWSYHWTMPAEVALALRGADYRAPFEAQPPAMVIVEADPESVESESAVAATAFADHAVAILDRVHRFPLPTLKAGGVGVRELTRLAKTVAGSEQEARVSLELAHASGLLETRAGVVGTSETFAAWRMQDPGTRLTCLLGSWWQLARTPSESRDIEDKSVPALSPKPDCSGCRATRVALLEEMSRLSSGEAAGRQSVAGATLWRRPLLHGSAQDAGMPFATFWAEAELLGILSHNAISRLGRVLLSDDQDALDAQTTALLPPSSDQASFGTDLTAMVVGAPSARVSSLLDSCADRQGRGGATMWRLSPVSVRRALDEGTTGPELEQLLSSIASTGLPQPLRYLIADVARRHGLLRVSPAISVIRSEDPALLAEVAVDRKLKSLGLRLLAPTILTCEVPVDEALAAMRSAGYFPLPERSDDGAATPANGIPADSDAAPPGTRSGIAGDVAPRLIGGVVPRTAREPADPADPASVAARLVGRRQRPLRVAPSGTEAILGRLNRRLPEGEMHQLAHAIDHGQHAVIDYAAASGGRTVREISDIELIGGSLYAQCGLRQEPRVFTVSQIQSVSPAL